MTTTVNMEAALEQGGGGGRGAMVVAPYCNSNDGNTPTPLRMDDYDVDEKGAQRNKRSWTSPWTITATALLCSFAAMTVGLALILVSYTKQQQQQQEADSDLMMNQNLSNSVILSSSEALVAQEEWLHLRNNVLPSQVYESVLLQPSDSPQAMALRWLAVLYGTDTDTTTTSSTTVVNNNKLDPVQRYALAVLYYHWAGPLWDMQEGEEGGAWLIDTTPTSATTMNECEWMGLACNEDQSSVTVVNFTNPAVFSSISGFIPSELAYLTGLERLLLPNHGLQGSIPDALYTQLTSLVELDLSSNQLTSVVTPQLANLAKLEIVRLSLNRLTDVVTDAGATALQTLLQMRVFEVDSNPDLTCGSGAVGGLSFLDKTVSFWRKIEVLNLSFTNIFVKLPERSLSLRWSNLEVLQASHVPLDGTISYEVGSLKNLRILKLDSPNLNSKGLQGSLPANLGALSNLEILDLRTNSFASTIPTEFGKMSALKELHLFDNVGIVGTIPTEFGQLQALEILDVSATRLSGDIPSELAQCPALANFKLQDSMFGGTMPADMCKRKWKSLWANCVINNERGTQHNVECPCCTDCFG